MINDTAAKPTTHQADLAKLPRALAPLIERPQWVGVEMDTARRRLAEAAVHGDATATPRQHEGSQHLGGLRYRAGCRGDRKCRRYLIHPHRGRSICGDRS